MGLTDCFIDYHPRDECLRSSISKLIGFSEIATNTEKQSLHVGNGKLKYRVKMFRLRKSHQKFDLPHLVTDNAGLCQWGTIIV